MRFPMPDTAARARASGRVASTRPRVPRSREKKAKGREDQRGPRENHPGNTSALSAIRASNLRLGERRRAEREEKKLPAGGPRQG